MAKASRRDYYGCGAMALGFLVLASVSFGVGLYFRPDNHDPRGPKAKLAEIQTADDYRLVGFIDESDEPCVILNHGDEMVTGQCSETISTEDDPGGHYGYTSAKLGQNAYVFFGPLPRRATSVTITLSDGTIKTAEARDSPTSGVTWFVIESKLDAQGPPVLRDNNGDELIYKPK